MPCCLSQLAVVDALLNNKETAISEAKRAVEMLPVSKDAVDGPGILDQLSRCLRVDQRVGSSF